LGVDKLNRNESKWTGLALFGCFCLLCAGTGLEIAFGNDSGLLEISGLMVLSGFLVAGVFAYLGLREAGDQRKIIAPLYAADLIGGALGSLLASLFLAPVAGLAISAYLMIPLIIFAALLL
jgi:hypothetical protein